MNSTILEHFQKVDPILFETFHKLAPAAQQIEVIPKPPETFFNNLCESIVSQQLSVKASDTIWKRFNALFPEQQVSPNLILATEDEVLRSVGLSRGKAIYLKALSDAVVKKELDFDAMPTMSNEEVIRSLTWVKGIGQWTAEMFMMFTLGRPDIFSMGDLGLKNAIQGLYGKKEQPLAATEIQVLVSRWSPYKTYAARILWQSLELPIDRS